MICLLIDIWHLLVEPKTLVILPDPLRSRLFVSPLVSLTAAFHICDISVSLDDIADLTFLAIVLDNACVTFDLLCGFNTILKLIHV